MIIVKTKINTNKDSNDNHGINDESNNYNNKNKKIKNIQKNKD